MKLPAVVRMRGLLLAALTVVLLLAAGAVGAAWQDFYAARDFSSLYHGARLVGSIDVYDDVQWCREARSSSFGALDPSGRELCPAVFLYPLWTAVVLRPLGLLPLEAAASLWLGVSLGATIVGARLSWQAVGGTARAAPLFATVLFASQPFWLNVSAGQLGGVLLLGAALGALLLARGRHATSGASLAILALKPHVLGLAALALLARAVARRAWRYVLGAIGGVALLLLVSLPASVSWPLEWLRESFGRQTGYSPTLATAWGLAAHDLGNVLFAPVLITAAVLAALWIAGGVPRGAVGLVALAVPLALFATPYAWSYDFVALALPWAFVVAHAARADARARYALLTALLLAASFLPWSLYAIAFQRGVETLSATVPLAASLLVAVAARRESGTYRAERAR
jgi:hypothetical protein